MPPENVTALVAELDARHGAPVADRVQDVVLRAGAVEVDTQATAGGDRLIWAEFHSVGDSARAAVELARTLSVVTDAPQPAEPAPGVRMALCTGSRGTDEPRGTDWTGSRSGGTPRARATALVEQAEPGQILATATTAIVAGGGLPPGVDLVDRGSRTLGPGRTSERIYELRIHGVAALDRPGRADRPGDGGVARSNVEWARRAVEGVDGAAHELDERLEALTAAWRTALDGRRHTVLLSGRGGAGKTRIAAELALRLHAEGALVLYGRWDRDVPAPYQGIREAFGVYADGCSVEQLRADLEGRGGEIARLLPDVGARIGGPGTGGAAPLPVADDERARLFEAIEAWIGALARRRPTLLVLDDVHWAEPSSLLLVDHLHHASAGIPLLVVVTAADPDGDGDGDGAEGTDVLAHAEAGEVQRIDLDH